MRKTATLLALPALAFMVACETSPCDDYVDYMCSCHPDSADCSALQTTYSEADADLQDACLVSLEEQEAVDEAAGETCDPYGTTDTGGNDTGV